MKAVESFIDAEKIAFRDAIEAQETLGFTPLEATEAAILDKLKGTEADPERIGAEFMPDSIVLEIGDPNETMRVTGLGFEIEGGSYFIEDPSFGISGDIGTKFYSNRYSGTPIWFAIYRQDGAWFFENVPAGGEYSNSVGSAALTPDDITETWVINPQPVIEAVPYPASHIGQLLKSGGVWYRWTGSAWDEDAAGGAMDQAAITAAITNKATFASSNSLVPSNGTVTDLTANQTALRALLISMGVIFNA